MPEVAAADVVSSVRSELQALKGRYADLDRQSEELARQRAALDQEHAELSAALKVLERHVARTRPSRSASPRDATRLSERVLAFIEEVGVATRSSLLAEFRPGGVKDDAVDSVIRRLVERGVVRRDGRQLFPGAVGPGSAPVPPAPGSGSVDSSVGTAAVGPAVDPAGVDPGSGAADGRPLTVRILEAVETATVCTRRDLVRHFRSLNVTSDSVDSALFGLRKRGRLVRRGDVLELSGQASRPDSSDSGAASQDS